MEGEKSTTKPVPQYILKIILVFTSLPFKNQDTENKDQWSNYPTKNYLGLPSSLTKWRKGSQKLTRINLKIQNLLSARVRATNCMDVKPSSSFRDRGTKFFKHSVLPPSYFLYQKSSGHLSLVNAILCFANAIYRIQNSVLVIKAPCINLNIYDDAAC